MTQKSRVKATVSPKKSAALKPGALLPSLKVEKLDSKLLQLYIIDNFMSPQECEDLVNIVNSELRPSTLAQYEKDLSYRTSETCDLGWIDHPHIKDMEERMARCMGIRLTYAQNTEAQKYEVGGEFKAHTDCYAPGTSRMDQHIEQEGQRTWTFMVCLKEPTKGGGTRFVKLDHTITPKTGRAVVWNNLLRDGSPNLNSLHQGLPVEEGTKIIITKWFIDKGVGRAWY